MLFQELKKNHSDILSIKCFAVLFAIPLVKIVILFENKTSMCTNTLMIGT